MAIYTHKYKKNIYIYKHDRNKLTTTVKTNITCGHFVRINDMNIDIHFEMGPNSIKSFDISAIKNYTSEY